METSKGHNQKQSRLVVLGAGESGVGAAILGMQQGFDVFVSDFGEIQEKYKAQLQQEGIRFEERGHTESEILKADLLIKSPGIPKTAAVIQRSLAKKVRMLSEIEFASQYTSAKLICITGSNGKTTTARLSWYILKNAGLNVELAGNIGKSFAWQVAKGKADYYVLEISSFMLDDMEDFRANIAVLLNITPDHMDRYDHKMKNYIDSKFKIIKNQKAEDVFIYGVDDPEIQKGLQEHSTPAIKYGFSQKEKLGEGAYLNEKNELSILIHPHKPFSMSINELALQGKHNVYNNMASGIIAKVLELRNETIRESMGDYQNIPHRLEHVAWISGINFINDSKATNVNSVWYGLESFPAGIVLILGGVDKGNDYQMLKGLVKSKVKGIVCIGDDTQRIHETFEEDTEIIVNANSMKDAVEIAYHLAKKGDTVLLSPACASFDWFKNYEDRGDQFKKAVKEL